MKKRIQGSLLNSFVLASVMVILGLIGLLDAMDKGDSAIYFATPPQVSDVLPDKMKVSWTNYPDFNDRTHYQVQINHSLYGSSTKITRAELARLEPGGTYDVQVLTYHEGKVVGVSSPTNVLMAAPTPQNVSLYDIGSASFKIIWQQVQTAEKYRVYRFPDILLAEVDEPGNKAEITGLTPGEAFNVFVTAVNKTGESYKSESKLVQLLPPPPILTIIEDDIGPTWFSMKWKAVDNAAEYLIFINDEEVARLASGTLNYRAEGLPVGTAVSAKVRTVNTSGESEDSETIIVQLLPATPILAATDVSSISCTLQWSVANGATYYKVFENNEWCIYNVPSSINQVVVTQNITEGMTATYTVKAGNGTGESEHSLPVVVTFSDSSSVSAAGSEIDFLPDLLRMKNDRLAADLRGMPLISVYFPGELDGPELALEATYLDMLSAQPLLNKIKFIGVFTREAVRLKKSKQKNIVWKVARSKTNEKFRLPGNLPLVKFYDSEGWLRSSLRVSMAIITPEDVFREIPEAFEQNAELIELYREEKEVFNSLHKTP
ncbi:MAG: hypothetical protein PWR01_4544 [Clostridiales bacterium]|jgi:hypothetical protein|nr:hypothetical protein [Clostridiales bacterium]MDN5283471.1 hypothetical protein [Candidatus Ozemobacter sp.]